jgi:hypothetical protein
LLLVLFHWSFHSRSIFVFVSGDGSFAWSRFSLRDCIDVKFSFFLLLVHACLSFCTSVLSAGGGKFLVFLSCSQAKGASQNSFSRFHFFAQEFGATGQHCPDLVSPAASGRIFLAA